MIGIASALISAGIYYLIDQGKHLANMGKVGLINFISATATALVLNEADAAGWFEGMELGASFMTGGVINAAATFLIDEVTGDTNNLWGDVCIGFFCGGFGGAVGGVGNGEEGMYLAGGALMGVLQDFVSSGEKNPF